MIYLGSKCHEIQKYYLNDQADRLGNDLSRSGILDLDSSVDILHI